MQTETLSTTATLNDFPVSPPNGKVEKLSSDDNATLSPPADHRNVLASLSPGRKNLLTLIFSTSMFLDSAGISAVFIMTAPIAADLNIGVAQEAWILTSYSLTFASFLLFAGRLADLYAPHLVFVGGFAGLGVLNLIVSFMDNRYAFFVLRAISGVAAVQTIPSSINMIVQMFPKREEQAGKLALFGLAGALANVLGLVLAGVFLLANWRWYFRFVAIVSIPFSLLAFWLLPKTQAVASDLPGAAKLKRMDLVGVLLMVATLALFILGFTSAASAGYASADFLAPFLISLASFVGFLVWESRLPEGYSLLPKGMWSYPNMYPLLWTALVCFMWFATIQLRAATYFQVILEDSAILTAAKIVPMGIIALVAGAVTQVFPTMMTRPRWTVFFSSFAGFVGSILFIYSNGGAGTRYWKFIFPGELIGTVGVLFMFIAINTGIIQSFPGEFAGVAGSVAQITFQIGGVIGIAVQTGLDETGNGLADWKATQAGWWFSGAALLAAGIAFGIFYRNQYEGEVTNEEKLSPAELASEELGV